MSAYIIGHPAYSGINAPAEAPNQRLASRGVKEEEALKKLRQARAYPFEHQTVRTLDGFHVVEFYYRAS